MPPKRPRRKPKGRVNKPPKLLALLMCERMETSPDGMQTLVRLFDRSTMDAQIELPEDAELPPLSIPYEFTVYARYGGGSGTFKHWLKVTNPSGKSHESMETEFWLRDAGKMHNLVSRIRTSVSEDGRYWIAAYLDGRELAKIPWDVDINVRRIAARSS